ncbi:MAG TPA: 2-phosphosulfolactate phosphatase [Azospira sp.]|nr:2-phosphosulfolactate phosphatase [Azospira sp.]
MRTRQVFLDRLDAEMTPHDVVVVIDVLRSFSTAAYAFAAGAGLIYPVETIAAARRLQAAMPGALTTGAVGGGDPIPGFDFGNTPTVFQNLRLDNRPLIQSTAAGAHGITRFNQVRALFAGSLVCARATAAAIAALNPSEVTFVITGEWVDRDGDEDIACADYLAALLNGTNPDPLRYEQRVRNSDFGRRFLAEDNPNLPTSDLELCAVANRFDFAMQASRLHDHMVLRRVLPGGANR